MKRKLLIVLAVAAILALAMPLAGCEKPAETMTLPEPEAEAATELTRAGGFEDKAVVCRDCGGDFIFSAAEQEFYAEKGFQNTPYRCRPCREAASKRPVNPPRETFTAICAQCGAETQIPFEPRNDRPVYCSACYQARRES